MKTDKLSVGFLLGDTFKLVGSALAASLPKSKIDLSMEQFILLNAINSKDDLIQQDLARILKKDKSSILRQIDGLMKKKYIVRLSDSKDRRKKIIMMTKAGMVVLTKALKIEADLVTFYMGGLSETELKGLSKILSKIQDNLKDKSERNSVDAIN